MPIVAETYRFVLGVDTHAQTHQYALIDAPTGGVLIETPFPTSPAGLTRAASWISRHTTGDPGTVLVSIEGTNSYGATLSRLLLARGYRVIDAPSPRRDRGGNKNDRIDAVKAARNVLGTPTDRLVEAKTGDTTGILAVLLAARTRITTESTRAFNALVALLRGHDLGLDARRKPTISMVRQIARWRPIPVPATAADAAKTEAVTLARRVLELHEQARVNNHQLKTIVTGLMPVLLEQTGIGPVNAAIILTAWSYPGRVRNEAAFAHLAGVSPIQIASGGRDEYRLNRGGDRQLNRALHSITLTRMRMDPDTRSYVERRRGEGKSNRRIQRILKRYISRQTYRIIQNATSPEQVPHAA